MEFHQERLLSEQISCHAWSTPLQLMNGQLASWPTDGKPLACELWYTLGSSFLFSKVKQIKFHYSQRTPRNHCLAVLEQFLWVNMVWSEKPVRNAQAEAMANKTLLIYFLFWSSSSSSGILISVAMAIAACTMVNQLELSRVEKSKTFKFFF
jgi:hypothetical protein